MTSVGVLLMQFFCCSCKANLFALMLILEESEMEDFDSICNLSWGFDASEFFFKLALLSFFRFLSFLVQGMKKYSWTI